MGTISYRLFLVLFYSINFFEYLNGNRQRIILSGLYTHAHYPSIHFAIEQVNTQLLLSQTNLEFSLNQTEGIIHVKIDYFC